MDIKSGDKIRLINDFDSVEGLSCSDEMKEDLEGKEVTVDSIHVTAAEDPSGHPIDIELIEGVLVADRVEVTDRVEEVGEDNKAPDKENVIESLKEENSDLRQEIESMSHYIEELKRRLDKESANVDRDKLTYKKAADELSGQNRELKITVKQLAKMI